MIKLIPSQTLFIKSAITSALEKQNGELWFSVASRGAKQVFFRWHSENTGEPLLLVYPESSGKEPVAPQFFADELLSSMEENGEELRIEDDTQTIRFSLQGKSVSRETLPPSKVVLKTAEWAVGKATYLDPNQAASLLQAIELMTPEGEIKAPMRKKYKQVNHFLDQVALLLKPAASGKPFILADCGCGKTYLGFVLYWYLRKVLKLPAKFYGVDISEKLISQNEKRAQKLSLPDMQFECMPILQSHIPDGADLLVSLHACDTATDEAIAAGVAARARHIVVVPCCQHEIANQIQEIPMYPLSGKHGIFTHRFGDLLTDMMRVLFLESHGYTVTAGEFVSPFETPKNLMLRATRGNHHTAARMQEYTLFKQFYKISPAIDLFYIEREALNQRV